MKDLTNLEEIKKIDPQNTVQTTEMLPEQIRTAWEQVKALPIQPLQTKITNVVFCGMGASIYGTLVLRSLLQAKLPFPIEVITDYHIPSYVNKNTLVVLTSYSGTTEEVLSCANEAQEKKAQMLILTKGGPLSEFAKANNIPAYIFDGKLNLSSTPRLGAGYTIIGLLGLFNKLGLISLDEILMQSAFANLESKKEVIKEEAIKESEIFVNRIPIIIAAEHLSGSAQILRNQFNETSKAFSAFYLVPDLNHHLMEGLQFPKDTQLYFIILNSKQYSAKIKRRMELTIDVIKKNNHMVFVSESEGKNIYEDFLEVLMYGSYLTLYLGLRYDQNPAINPWVDYFKEQLK